MTITAHANQIDRPAPTYLIKANRANHILRLSKHRLHAYKTEGRYICRIVNQYGNTASVSSRPTLEEAITVAIGHIT